MEEGSLNFGVRYIICKKKSGLSNISIAKRVIKLIKQSILRMFKLKGKVILKAR